VKISLQLGVHFKHEKLQMATFLQPVKV